MMLRKDNWFCEESSCIGGPVEPDSGIGVMPGAASVAVLSCKDTAVQVGSITFPREKSGNRSFKICIRSYVISDTSPAKSYTQCYVARREVLSFNN